MSEPSKKIYVDIDNTIAITNGCNYTDASPIPDRIKIINKWYDEGHEITYWTARGTLTKKDYFWITRKQLEEWGAKHHHLKMGKPAFDFFIDDKAFNSKELDKIEAPGLDNI